MNICLKKDSRSYTDVHTAASDIYQQAEMALSGISATEIYGTQLTQSDPYTSKNQSNGPRNLKQVQNSLRNVPNMRKKSENTREKQSNDDELMNLSTLRQNCDFLKTVSFSNAAYFALLYQPREINDFVHFCCKDTNATTFAIDAIFNLCNL